ncbi:TRAP transporter substrate-binding protein [Azospirillum rugosum]|uniref:TRAP-type mannitol/chloroaromatic compound transport system substrate-binding protein n=1 Tax=Azospirillum rugosum TaxID=416170 RepID=A0ABS4SR63_9PROT|nr:ABC transporter substrate-binding protein [Azospirillum rugosum]MBP2295049.1 TRAP-type mannitol/chloroaromatic compound transport system substrate-binding protein [Azospirillum rugosum]MDQ0528872.1 TRAP-type mannitol/chloroaromatic compound transport system substrate-binding protein [Azospirillum rugosum]
MERRHFLTALGLGLGGGAFATPVVAQSRPEIRWTMATAFSADLDILQGGAEFLAGRVATLTAGRVNIGLDPTRSAGSGARILDDVGTGAVPMALTASYNALDKEPALAFDTALPFGLNARQQNAWMYHGGGLALFRELLADHGVVPFPAGNTGSQLGGWFRREINTVQDLNGLKVRVSGLAGDVLKRLGAAPQNTPSADLGRALEQGTLDAAAWVGPHDDRRLGLHKAARYCYYPGILEGNAQISCYVNRQAWERLAPEDREAIDAACADANLWVTSRYDALSPVALKQLVAEGALLRPFPLDVIRAAYRAAEEQLDALASGNPWFRKIHDSWKPFRDDQHLWFRIAESSFDRFASLRPGDKGRN